MQGRARGCPDGGSSPRSAVSASAPGRTRHRYAAPTEQVSICMNQPPPPIRGAPAVAFSAQATTAHLRGHGRRGRAPPAQAPSPPPPTTQVPTNSADVTVQFM